MTVRIMMYNAYECSFGDAKDNITASTSSTLTVRAIVTPTIPRQPYAGTQIQSQAPVSSADWKLAVGELGLNLRRELAGKVGREEVKLFMNTETSTILESLDAIDTELKDKVSSNDFSKVENSLSALHARVVSELTGGLWLWTSR